MYGYTDITNHSVKQLGSICAEGIKVGNLPSSLLAKPSHGTLYVHVFTTT